MNLVKQIKRYNPMLSNNNPMKLDVKTGGYQVDLSIITVSYNGLELLKSSLESISRINSRITFEVIVVDNASHDDISSMVKENFPQVHFIQNSANLGFSKANNVGIRASKGEFVLLLNPDTQLANESSLDALYEFMRDHPDVGAAGGKLVYPGGREQISAGYRLTPLSLFNFSFFLAKITNNRLKGFSHHPGRPIHTDSLPVDWICAACMIVRREVMETTGLLNEDYFLYGEDIEWGCRMTEDGWKLGHLPAVQIEHVLGGTQLADGKPDLNAEKISTVWLDGMERVYFDLNPGASRLFYRVVFGCGLYIRAFLYGMGTLISSNPWFKFRRRDMVAWGKYVLLGR